MATIEERAHSAYCGRTTCTPENKIQRFCVNCLHDGRKKAYIKGAEDQRKIDIDKACEWLKENVNNYLYNTGGFEEYIPQCGGAMFIDFRKAMEE